MLKKLVSILAVLLVFAGLPASVFAEVHGEPPVEELEQQFHDLIFQETTEDQQLTNYDSLDALEFDFRSIMVWPLADHYMNQYFYEENGNVYLVATEGPIEINMDEDYTLEQISDTEYQLTQSSSNELWGDYTLTITYSYEAGKWVFADRNEVIGDGGTGGEMPDTATATPTMVLVGIALISAGALMIVRRRMAVE